MRKGMKKFFALSLMFLLVFALTSATYASRGTGPTEEAIDAPAPKITGWVDDISNDVRSSGNTGLKSENETGVTEEAIDAPAPKVTGKVDILNGEIGPKGDSRPREVWDLTSEDYSFSGKFYEYTYTFYQFRPNSDGELRVRIDASEVNGNTTTLYYTLYDSDDDEALSVNLGEYSSWETTRRISNLDTSETYYIKFHKPDDGYRIKATGTVSHP